MRRYACYCAFCNLASVGPTESPDDGRRMSCLRHHHAADRLDSSTPRGYGDGVPTSASVPPCRSRHSRDRCCPPDRSWPCSRAELCASHPRAVSPARSRLLWLPIGLRFRLIAPSVRLSRVEPPICEPSCLSG